MGALNCVREQVVRIAEDQTNYNLTDQVQLKMFISKAVSASLPVCEEKVITLRDHLIETEKPKEDMVVSQAQKDRIKDDIKSAFEKELLFRIQSSEKE